MQPIARWSVSARHWSWCPRFRPRAPSPTRVPHTWPAPRPTWPPGWPPPASRPPGSAGSATDPLGEFLRAELQRPRRRGRRRPARPRPADRLLRQAGRARRPRATHPDALPPRRLRRVRDGSRVPRPPRGGRPAGAAPAGAHQRHHRGALRLLRGADAGVAGPPARGRLLSLRRQLARAALAGRRPGPGRRAGPAGRRGAGRRGRGPPGVRHRRPGARCARLLPDPGRW